MREYREVPGWPSYRVSNDGVVESRTDTAGYERDKWIARKPSIDKDGYERLKLHYRGRITFIGVHTLVLICFGPPRPPGKSMCLHNDGSTRNNHISNLRWGFGDDNARDREKHGRTAACDRSGNAKLTWEQVGEIRKLYATAGLSLNQLARQFGVSKKCVLNIVHKKTWVRTFPGQRISEALQPTEQG